MLCVIRHVNIHLGSGIEAYPVRFWLNVVVHRFDESKSTRHLLAQNALGLRVTHSQTSLGIDAISALLKG